MAGGPKRLDLVGQRFGMLLVIKKMPSDKIATKFKCKCDCGNERVIVGSELNRGNWKSCGCNRTPRTTHDYREHPLYDVWKGMKARCNNKNHSSSKNYSEKGVSVCQEWDNDFIVFYNWAMSNGWQPGLQLDKDIRAKELGVEPILYSPGTCCFVTQEVNNQNRSNTKLNLEAVNEIRASSDPAEVLAARYNISVSHLLKIKRNKKWINK